MSLPGQQNPYFAAMVTTVDWSLGRIVTYLENTDDPRNPGKKLSETTYLFFTSDNGGETRKGGNNFPLRGNKVTLWEGGTRVPTFITGPDDDDTNDDDYTNDNDDDDDDTNDDEDDTNNDDDTNDDEDDTNWWWY